MSVQSGPVFPVSPGKEPAARASRQPSPQITAWLILLFSFGLFCLLLYILISAITGYLSHSVQYKTADVQVVKDKDDNVFVLHHGQAKETVVTSEETLQEGDEVRTDKNSEAVIYLFDGGRL